MHQYHKNEQSYFCFILKFTIFGFIFTFPSLLLGISLSECEQVFLPPGLLRRVDEHLREFLSQKSRCKGFQDISVSRTSSSGSIATDEGLFEQPEPQGSSKAVMEKILWRRSSHLRDQQQAWQVQFSLKQPVCFIPQSISLC